MPGMVEKLLQAEAQKRGVTVRACHTSIVAQMMTGKRNRLTVFYVRRDGPRHEEDYPHNYEVTRRYEWPTPTQVQNAEWMAALFDDAIQRLDRSKAERQAYRAVCLAQHAAEEAFRNSPEEKAKSRARKEKYREEVARLRAQGALL